MNKYKPYLLIILASLLLSISRLPLHGGFMVFFAWTPLLIFFETRKYNLKELFISSALFTGIFVVLVLYWIATVTLPGLIGIWIIYLVFCTLVFWVIQRIWHHLPRLKYAGFIAVFISLEYLQQFGETRFPWLNISYSLTDYLLLLQALDLIGSTGLSLLILSIGVLIYRAYKGRLKSLVSIALILIAWVAYGLFRVSSLELKEHDARIFVSQPSIPQDQKWDADFYKEILARYDRLISDAKADSASLVILPEASFPVYLLRDPGQLDPLKRLLNTYGVDIFAGFPDYHPAPKGHYYTELYYNAAALFKKGDYYPTPYYKNILVPVGERMLWLDIFPFLWKLDFEQANWEFGTEMVWYKSGEYEFAPSICYEIAFPELYHHSSIPRTKDGYRKTDYQVNVTNDAWFGTSYGPWLHGSMTKYRAIENRIQIYRSAQTGISMIIDPLGRTLSQTKLFEIGNISAPLYTCDAIPPIRRIYKYPILISIFAALAFIWALFRPAKAARNS